MGKNVNSEPTLKIDTLVTIREEAAEGAEKKALKYNKKENLPGAFDVDASCPHS